MVDANDTVRTILVQVPLLVIAITSYTIPHWGTPGAIFALIFVELFETIVVWKFIFPRLQNPPQTA